MLKTLCDLNGTSGNEAAVRDYILEQIQPYCTACTVDAMGSVIAFKKGKRTPEKRVMLSAHMDEVGFIITGATEEGYLQFAPVGGINPSVVLGRRLALENGGFGMVGTVPIHLLHEDAREKVPSFDELLIDVGAADKQTAEKIAPVGSFAYFSESYIAFGDGKICAKALDDRIGCMLMIELLQSELEADTWFCFQVQEEVGLRGAACTGSRVQPDRVLVLEATTVISGCACLVMARWSALWTAPPFMTGRYIVWPEKQPTRTVFPARPKPPLPAATMPARCNGPDREAQRWL